VEYTGDFGADVINCMLEKLAQFDLESVVKGRLAIEAARDFALRHPLLTGITTLGIWPHFARRRLASLGHKIVQENMPYLRRMWHSPAGSKYVPTLTQVRKLEQWLDLLK